MVVGLGELVLSLSEIISMRAAVNRLVLVVAEGHFGVGSAVLGEEWRHCFFPAVSLEIFDV